MRAVIGGSALAIVVWAIFKELGFDFWNCLLYTAFAVIAYQTTLDEWWKGWRS